MSRSPVTAVVIGAGHRALCYADLSRQHPDRLRIVGVADPDPARRRQTAQRYSFSEDKCFRTAEELAQQPAFADAAINGTMDRDHVPTTLPLLRAGYHVLLEKPITPIKRELLDLEGTVRRTGRKVMIGHVLRYAPFYVEIKKRLLAGEIGRILSIETAENVSYHHMAVGFVRGKWRNRDSSAPMLLAKCCHDLDLLCWYMSGIAPQRVASFGNLMHFRPENAPPGSGTRCLADCEIEAGCPYSARKNYIEQNLWGMYAWQSLEHIEDLAEQKKIESLKSDNPHGRCVWRCDNDVVDHQSVIVEYADGVVATHNMFANTSRPCRTIHIVGTAGEIRGAMEDGHFFIHKPDARAGHEFSEERIDINVSNDMHGGGDMRLADDFVRVVSGRNGSISSTDIHDSIHGHMIAFAADDSMLQKRMIELNDIQ
ncbi:MAG: Gfo/Idh/MocA family oxidoreductase [Phycisphaerae bacterium]|nr:Gfo/Idh/MocA family oxidoreductase [Phycisphaerae bacterium]